MDAKYELALAVQNHASAFQWHTRHLIAVDQLYLSSERIFNV